MRRFAKPVYGVNLYRGFESLPLRLEGCESLVSTGIRGFFCRRIRRFAEPALGASSGTGLLISAPENAAQYRHAILSVIGQRDAGPARQARCLSPPWRLDHPRCSTHLSVGIGGMGVLGDDGNEAS
jgi:hypothetical protein